MTKEMTMFASNNSLVSQIGAGFLAFAISAACVLAATSPLNFLG